MSQQIKRVLISVTDKQGLIPFAAKLIEMYPSIQIIASGGTAKALEEGNIAYTLLEKYTGFPECFNGRVKTLHPFIAGGILMRRGADEDDARRVNIEPIDMVVCNLYQFEKAASNPNLSIDELIEFMDIGGSTLIRSSCKNYRSVAIVTDPSDYPSVIRDLEKSNGALSLEMKQKLAVKAINVSANYENALAMELTKRLSGEETHRPVLSQGKELRYGENPDQKAWIYNFNDQEGISQGKILSGKELSYNNYEDATVAYHATNELKRLGYEHSVAIIKHGSLCGYATGPSLEEAFRNAWKGDEKSAFGSVIAFTSIVSAALIPDIENKYIEVMIAPYFSHDFLSWAKRAKPNLRLIEAPENIKSDILYKAISGGMLIQTRKKKLFSVPIEQLFQSSTIDDKRVGVVTKREPKQNQSGLFTFAVAAVNYAKSNAITIAREWREGYYQLLGVGSGQPNRVDSLQRLAIPKAIENLRKEHANDAGYDPKVDLSKCVLASDGFFPFDDSVRYASEFGIKYCVQPGGSVRDDDVIKAADELDMCMIFTGERYFTH